MEEEKGKGSEGMGGMKEICFGEGTNIHQRKKGRREGEREEGMEEENGGGSEGMGG